MMLSSRLVAYADVVGNEVIDHLHQLARPLQGARVVHVNSTRVGGGVAEILEQLVPMKRELGIDATWEVLEGQGEFYGVTKAFHNGLQGMAVNLTPQMFALYEETNRQNLERLEPILADADVVFIHDPQPAPLLNLIPRRKGKWVWRCHIDVSRPHRAVWKYLRPVVAGYDASIFSLAAFAQPLPHLQYLIPPSIDPLSPKNVELDPAEIEAVRTEYGLDPDLPTVVQVSRFDWFKDPIGVIRACRLARPYAPLQLVLAGGGATDDPEGEQVLAAVREEAGDDPHVHILLLPPDAHRTINALQRTADIVVQKSLKEGFGLTVTEAMWKGKPVIGGDTGGIVLQVIDYHTGFRVSTPEGAAFRLRYLLTHPEQMATMGAKAQRFVHDHFLLTRHLREYLTLMVGLLHGSEERIELG
jgi:trehalose synthase